MNAAEAPRFSTPQEYFAHIDQDLTANTFVFVADCSGKPIGYVYRDCGLGYGFKFAPFSHGLSAVIHGVDLDRTIAVLDAFQVMYSRPQLERIWARSHRDILGT